MIDFLLRIPKNGKLSSLKPVRGIQKPSPSKNPYQIDLLTGGPKLKTFYHKGIHNHYWGDLLLPGHKETTPGLLEEWLKDFSPEKLRDTGGLFYLVRFFEKEGRLEIYNSMFGLTPLYYYQGKKHLWISSHVEHIVKNSPASFDVDKQFLLEQTLFNYSLGKRTFFKGISLVPANSYLSMAPAPEEIKHTFISHYFQDKPLPWRKSAKETANFFLDRVEGYFPDEAFNISFTGGFDGRTLTATALYHRKEFSTYSFGTSDYFDILLPLEQSKKLGISYTPFYLDRGYVGKESLEQGLELVRSSGGDASFARSHYVFAARELAKSTKVIISGNFGSEIFRALRHTGVVFSRNLANLFTAPDLDEALAELPRIAQLSGLNMSNFKEELDQLVREIRCNQVFQPGEAPANFRFYTYMYEEVFRKYFGPELMMQSRYVMNRTPFLDFRFLERLLQTGAASVYSKILEQKPLKRFKGQVIYGHILKQAHPEIASLPVTKGYRPIDLLTPMGKLRVFRSYLRGNPMKLLKAKDPFAVRASFSHNRETLKTWPIDEEIFNRKFIQDELRKSDMPLHLDHFINLLSLSYYYNYSNSYEKKG